MIWLKENQKLVGYVPILEKEYEEMEIREMSKYHCYSGWSKLSEFVMKIQGIEFVYYYGIDETTITDLTEVQRLVDVRFCFDFECFLQDDFRYYNIIKDSLRMKIYKNQIFDVFQNLTLYKLKELSEKEAKEEIAQEKEILERLALYNIDKYLLDIKCRAEKSSNNLSNLLKMFENNVYISGKHYLFANIDEAITKKIYEERKAKTRLKW